MLPQQTPLQQRDHEVFWHPCSQMKDYKAFPPLEVVAAKGSRIQLADGRWVYDAISSWWCKSLGHGHPRLKEALRQQFERFEHVITANTTNDAIVSLCERLIAVANPSQERHFVKVFFADNGSTGVEVALKMALQAQYQRGETQRTKLAAFANGYHGETVGAMSVSDLDLYTSPHGSMMFPVTKLGPLPYRAGPYDPRWMDVSEEWPAIEQQLESIRHELAAVIYEPVLQAAAGMKLYSPAVLSRLRRWADAQGVYLIADEIAAGLYRCGSALASHLFATCRALPDFAVLSKGLTAGMGPMSVVLTTQPVYDLFYADYFTGKAFLHSNTYAGHALGVAVAHAALDVYRDENIPARVCAIHGLLRERFTHAVEQSPCLRNPRILGAVAAIDLYQRDGTPWPRERRTGYRVYQESVRRGALCRPLGDTMYLFPPLNVTDAELHEMADILFASIDAMLAQ